MPEDHRRLERCRVRLQVQRDKVPRLQLIHAVGGHEGVSHPRIALRPRALLNRSPPTYTRCGTSAIWCNTYLASALPRRVDGEKEHERVGCNRVVDPSLIHWAHSSNLRKEEDPTCDRCVVLTRSKPSVNMGS